MSTSDPGITVTRKRGYTVVFNDLLPTDGSLSARAWGLYVYLVGRPDGWETRVSHLRKVFSEGRDAIYTALGELVTAGLMDRETFIDGGLRRVRYALNADGETAGQAPRPDSQEPGKPDPDSQDAGTPDAGDPAPGKPGEVSKEVVRPEGATTEQPTPEKASGDGDAAARLAQEWWDYYSQTFGPIVRNGRNASPFVALRDNLIGAALRSGYTETEIKWALRGPQTSTPDPIPAKPVFQRRLSEVRNGRGQDNPSSNVHHLPDSDPDRQRRIGYFTPSQEAQ